MNRAKAAFVAMISSIATLGFGAAAPAQQAPGGQQAFMVCAACHSTRPNEARMGPTLYRIVGRKPASIANYAYSPGLAKLKTNWTRGQLDAFLKNPQAVVPGTKMPFGGIPDDARRAALISYLATLK
jgi:cytochrome c